MHPVMHSCMAKLRQLMEYPKSVKRVKDAVKKERKWGNYIFVITEDAKEMESQEVIDLFDYQLCETIYKY